MKWSGRDYCKRLGASEDGTEREGILGGEVISVYFICLNCHLENGE